MNTDLNTLVDTLREIAYDAGCALLFPVDTDTTKCYADRYNCACRQLRTLAPCLTASVMPLSEDASAGTIRMAARTAAAHAQGATNPCFHRIAA